MWKPGTRIVRVVDGPYIDAGALATVIRIEDVEIIPGMQPMAPESDIGVLLDVAVLIPCNSKPYRDVYSVSSKWRPLDSNDSTGITSVEQLVQSLSKPKVEA